MDGHTKPGTTTGSLISETPILARDAGNTADGSTPAQAKSESASISVDQLLSLLQTDCFDLQRKGLRLVFSGIMTDRLGILIDWPGHKLGFENGKFTVDGHAV
jgi:hypothetical protein